MNFKEYLTNVTMEINNKLSSAYLKRIDQVTDCDFILEFNRQENILISLNSFFPFIKVINEKIHISLDKTFIQFLKSKLDNSKLISSEVLNDDNIIKLSFIKITETYDKEEHQLIIELFKNNFNLILVKNS